MRCLEQEGGLGKSSSHPSPTSYQFILRDKGRRMLTGLPTTIGPYTGNVRCKVPRCTAYDHGLLASPFIFAISSSSEFDLGSLYMRFVCGSQVEGRV